MPSEIQIRVTVPDEEVPAMRAAADAAAGATSLRGIAREIGMSPTGLRKFLNGAAPYSPTLRRLRRWYAKHATQESE